eukprot:10651768-Lingulodinium_polyedra.AAC.1
MLAGAHRSVGLTSPSGTTSWVMLPNRSPAFAATLRPMPCAPARPSRWPTKTRPSSASLTGGWLPSSTAGPPP